MIVGRDAESARVDAILRAGGALLVRGEPGIGKTALLASRVLGERVVRALGVEDEVELPFGALGDLVGQLGAFAAGPDVLRPVADRFTLYLAFLEQLRTAAPVTVVVDDVQWLDASSAEALRFVARRVGPGVTLLGATRDLTAEWPGAASLTLGGLAPDACRSVLGGGLTDEVALELAAAVGGNALALREAEALLTPEERSGLVPLRTPVPVGARLERLYAERASGLAPHTRGALLLVAAGGDVGDRLDDLESAEAAGLISLAGPRPVFAHPLMRSAIYHTASGAERRAAHAELATAAVGSTSAAWHLAAAAVGADELAAAALEDAGGAAETHGAVPTAIEAFRRAARLSVDAAGRRRRWSRAAQCAILAGDVGGARDAVDRLLQDPGLSAVEGADARMLLGTVMLLDGDPMAAYAMLVAESEKVEAVDRLRAAGLLAVAGVALMGAGDCEGIIAVARRAIGLTRDVPGADLAPTVMLAEALAGVGARADAATLLNAREAELLTLAELPPSPVHEIVVVAALGWMALEDWPRTERCLERLIAGARSAGAVRGLTFPLAMFGALEMRRGHWSAAAVAIEEALLYAEDAAPAFVEAFALCTGAYLDALCGNVARCRARCARAWEVEDRNGLTGIRGYHQVALGTMELSAGHVAEARTHFELASEHLRVYGAVDPGFLPADAELMELAVRSGEGLDLLEAFGARVEAAGGEWATAVYWRCRGMADGSDASFARALEAHDRLPMPFDRARTLLAWGERLRRDRRLREARVRLVEALAVFERLGAAPWRARAAAELAAAGGATVRAPAADATGLTAAEQRVVEAVVGGASNREVAERLFVSVRTVEHHLRQVFQKLGVRSRTELAAKLRKDP